MDAFTITQAMVEPIQTAFNSGVTTLLPTGIQLMSVLIGVSLIPRIIYRFI